VNSSQTYSASISPFVPTIDKTYIQNGRSKCKCQDPLIKEGISETKNWWQKVHQMNVDAASKKTNIDVLFLGDSITEGWHGTSRGHEIARAKGAQAVFSRFFEGKDAKYDGLALGISGDTSPNVLWRIQNGELPNSLHPKVIWLLLGTNDFGNSWCSPELVLIGILHVVEEIWIRKPNSIIVIHAILPRTFSHKGYVMRGQTSPLPSFVGNTKQLPSLWRDIVAVNEELRRYSAERENVEYVETKLFFVDSSASPQDLRINSSLMPDYLHPSVEGYERWGEEIVSFLEKII
jgi:lysophospholipase L1-like esterase